MIQVSIQLHCRSEQINLIQAFLIGIEPMPTVLENNAGKDRPMLGYCKSGGVYFLFN